MKGQTADLCPSQRERARPERALPPQAEAEKPRRKPQKVPEGLGHQGPDKPLQGHWVLAFDLSEVEPSEVLEQRWGLI